MNRGEGLARQVPRRGTGRSIFPFGKFPVYTPRSLGLVRHFKCLSEMEENLSAANEGKSTMVDPLAFSMAKRVYVQKTAIAHTDREVCVMLGTVPPFKDEDGAAPFIVDAVCFFDFERFKTFAKNVQERLAMLEEAETASDK